MFPNDTAVREALQASVGSPLLVATFNPGKFKEMQLSLAALPLQLVSLATLPGVKPAPEEGTTFEANARQKAVYYSRFTEWLTLADDSGLLVDALGGQPGIYSARYVSEQATDEERCQEILAQLSRAVAPRRTARFECCVALARAGVVLEVFRGTLEGLIRREARGRNGFGYDPIFQVPELGRSLAELTPEEKLRISHRGRALQEVRKALGSSWPGCL